MKVVRLQIMAQSKRRILKNNGIKINDKVVDDDKKVVGINEFEGKDYIKLSVGKKIHLKVTIT